eukprot:scaffold59449_cov42-Phaeocystis_antarctica.AAC.1
MRECNNRTRAALSDKCRSSCGSGHRSELMGRGGGDHEQRQKRLGERSTNRSQAAHAASPLPRRRARMK